MVRRWFVPSCVIVTVTFATVAPEGSVIVPFNSVLSICAQAKTGDRIRLTIIAYRVSNFIHGSPRMMSDGVWIHSGGIGPDHVTAGPCLLFRSSSVQLPAGVTNRDSKLGTFFETSLRIAAALVAASSSLVASVQGTSMTRIPIFLPCASNISIFML